MATNSIFPTNGKVKTLTIGGALIAIMGYLVELRTEVAVISDKVERIERIMETAPLVKK